jgi:2'-5' RNA ligase
MKRIFVALKIEPGDALLNMISSIRTLLGNERIKWVDPANIHLTLAFLGDTEDMRTEVADIALRKICHGFGEFSFNLTGTGVFKNFRDPRVIWAGIEECKRLIQLYDLIMKALRDTGFELEDRPFKPHITLGRIKFIRNLRLLESSVEKYRETHFQKVGNREVILFESILNPAGPVYKPLSKYKLT